MNKLMPKNYEEVAEIIKNFIMQSGCNKNELKWIPDFILGTDWEINKRNLDHAITIMAFSLRLLDNKNVVKKLGEKIVSVGLDNLCINTLLSLAYCFSKEDPVPNEKQMADMKNKINGCFDRMMLQATYKNAITKQWMEQPNIDRWITEVGMPNEAFEIFKDLGFFGGYMTKKDIIDCYANIVNFDFICGEERAEKAKSIIEHIKSWH